MYICTCNMNMIAEWHLQVVVNGNDWGHPALGDWHQACFHVQIYGWNVSCKGTVNRCDDVSGVIILGQILLYSLREYSLTWKINMLHVQCIGTCYWLSLWVCPQKTGYMYSSSKYDMRQAFLAIEWSSETMRFAGGCVRPRATEALLRLGYPCQEINKIAMTSKEMERAMKWCSQRLRRVCAVEGRNTKRATCICFRVVLKLLPEQGYISLILQFCTKKFTRHRLWMMVRKSVPLRKERGARNCTSTISTNLVDHSHPVPLPPPHQCTPYHRPLRKLPSRTTAGTLSQFVANTINEKKTATRKNEFSTCHLVNLAKRRKRAQRQKEEKRLF